MENLKELSYISQRIVCDAVNQAGVILNVQITKELKASVRSARQHYWAFLEAKKKLDLQHSIQVKKCCIDEEVESLKKKKLEVVVAELTASADSYAEKAETTSDLTWIIKSNSLRKSAKSKVQEILIIDLEVKKKQHQQPWALNKCLFALYFSRSTCGTLQHVMLLYF